MSMFSERWCMHLPISRVSTDWRSGKKRSRTHLEGRVEVCANVCCVCAQFVFDGFGT